MNTVPSVMHSAATHAPQRVDDPHTGNHLLAHLPPADLERFATQLEYVELPAGKELTAAGSASRYVWFPAGAIVSVLCMTEEGAAAEVAVIGREGMVGVSIFMGGSNETTHAVVHSAGGLFRMRADAMKTEFNRSETVRSLLLRYMQAMLLQASQTAVCNRHHSVEQQLCRRLLAAGDCTDSAELVMTHESIANALGVRRAGITEAANRLQRDGLVRYSRGRIAVLDRDALEERACECYAVVKGEYERLFPPRRQPLPPRVQFTTAQAAPAANRDWPQPAAPAALLTRPATVTRLPGSMLPRD